jgi:hypothetical protein
MGRLDIDDSPRTWSWNWGEDDNEGQPQLPQQSLVWNADREDGYEPQIMRGFE